MNYYGSVTPGTVQQTLLKDSWKPPVLRIKNNRYELVMNTPTYIYAKTMILKESHLKKNLM